MTRELASARTEGRALHEYDVELTADPRVPDLRAPDEAFIWASKQFARIQVLLPEMERAFKDRRAAEISEGLTGRGMAAIDRAGLLRIVFGVTQSEVLEARILQDYAKALLAFLRVDAQAIISAEIFDVQLPEASEVNYRRRIQALGLRAIRPSNG